MVALACSLWFGYAGAALADEEPTAAEPASEEAAPTAEEAAPAPSGETEEKAAEPAPAAESAPEEEAAAEEEGGGFVSNWANHVRNTFLGGVNGVITWPADPVMLAVKPTEEMSSLPGGVVTGPMVGFGAGTLLGLYRLGMGALDMVLAPLSFFPMFSPEPRYQVIPGWEHQE
jgi:hypothetical protein